MSFGLVSVLSWLTQRPILKTALWLQVVPTTLQPLQAQPVRRMKATTGKADEGHYR
ncbi:hypothetical protein ACFQ2P_05810 [Levilactobacillus namurensis]|uniref:hypothetical protein n=1 Tax=Levilactobacillus namurensis TaxID=380393 RepID=UPI0012E7E65E|nr:hypothetical protein [Levilactobacillus namurensis]